MAPPAHAPSLTQIIDKKSLRWVFVGGKGGVGKTSCSCSLAAQLAQNREKVLILSTDPAHNLSDAFSQKFSNEPTLVSGFENLFAMEIGPLDDSTLLGDTGFLAQVVQTFHGLEEALGFASLMQKVQTLDYDVVVFDTAPTGHTLRLLSFPKMLDQLLEKLLSLGDRFGPLLQQAQQMAAMFGLPSTGSDLTEDLIGKLEVLKRFAEDMVSHFRDPDWTTFVCVCIPEFLSLYETERLVQELTTLDIDCQHIIVNQILIPEEGCTSRLLLARTKMQQKYIAQIEVLYSEDFHVIRLPLLVREIRGTTDIRQFSRMLVDPSIVATNAHWDLLVEE